MRISIEPLGLLMLLCGNLLTTVIASAAKQSPYIDYQIASLRSQ